VQPDQLTPLALMLLFCRTLYRYVLCGYTQRVHSMDVPNVHYAYIGVCTLYLKGL